MDFQSPELLAKRRQLTWDMFCHDHFYLQQPDVDFYQRIGLTHASDEVLDMEHTASHDRLNSVGMLAGRIHTLAGLAGEIAAKGMLDPHDEDTEEVAPMWASLIGIGATAIIAELVDSGLLIPAGGQFVHV